MRTLSDAQIREMERLLGRADVQARSIGEARASRWAGAPVEVLAALPPTGYRLVASLRLTGTAQCATAIVHERPSTERTLLPGSVGREVSALVVRARELGADAIVLHGAVADMPRGASSAGA